jgi:hypothetical protein
LATSSPGHGGAAATLLDECRAALALWARALAPLESLGEAGELGGLRESLERQLARGAVAVELRGETRLATLEAILGEPVGAVDGPLAGATIRVRRATALDYQARWPDGRTEALPPDCSQALVAALAEAERDLAAATAANAEAPAVAATTPAAATEPAASPTAGAAAATAATGEAVAPVAVSWWRRLLARLRRLFARSRPLALPSAAPTPTPAPPDSATTQPIGLLGVALQASEAVSARQDLVERRRRELEDYRELRHRRALARVAELLTARAAPPVELQLGAPDVPAGVELLLPPGSGEVSTDAGATVLVARAAASDPEARAELLRQLERIGRDQPSALAERIATALRSLRERIHAVDQRARAAYQTRAAALRARCLGDVGARHRQELAAVQLPVARDADQLVQEAVGRLELLLSQVRNDWEQRIGGCVAGEQLRSEVAAIEDGAARRLAIVFDELREAIAVGSTRLVLELSRSLRMELLQARAEVAGDGSSKVEETFDGLRGVLPASLDAAFGQLSAPGLGALMTAPHGLLDPLFRTLAKEKRECLARLGARLDEIERTTTRELFAAAVYLSPLLLDAYGHVVGEVLTGHQRWLDERIDAEQVVYEDLHARYLPALALVGEIEQAENRLGARTDGRGEPSQRRAAGS